MHAGLHEYYLALSGPTAALPDLHSNTTLSRFASVLHSTLELPHTYPVYNILVRLVEPDPAAAATAGTGRRLLLNQQVVSMQESHKARPTIHLTSNPPPECKAFLIRGLNQLILAASGCSAHGTRRMLQDSPASAVSAVLGVKFTPGPGLPSDEVLSALLARSSTMRDLAGELAAVGFVAVLEAIKVAQSDSRGYPKNNEQM